jgi:hypothetical protein
MPVPFCLSHSGCPGLNVLFYQSSWMFCSGCPALPILFCLSCSVCPILPVLFCQVCFAFPVLCVLSRLSCPYFPVLTFPSSLRIYRCTTAQRNRKPESTNAKNQKHANTSAKARRKKCEIVGLKRPQKCTREAHKRRALSSDKDDFFLFLSKVP